MEVLFIADPLENFKIYKDTTYAIMQEIAKRGLKLYHALADDLIAEDAHIYALTRPVMIQTGETWFSQGKTEKRRLKDFSAVLMRTDPPFNTQYLFATYLLTLAEKEGAKVFNSGAALRKYNEKLAILDFSEWIAPTLVTTNPDLILIFLGQYQDIIVKPLDGMGGREIFRLHKADPNLGSILEIVMHYGTRTIMAQKYIPDIKKGDKRILIIDGQVVPYTMARIAKKGETRANLAAGGTANIMPLTEKEYDLATELAPTLLTNGVFLAGLDMIGPYLTEINVTSPMGFQEISKGSDCKVAALFVDRLLGRLEGNS